MFDQSHGLRFDIYERIHLPAELPGIAELEEVELIPDIQVIQREDRAELYGQLLLTGLYRGEDDRTQRLEHAIPVEITVPLTRVSSLDDIGVEIENFDIDLLTMRTVNITGVLSLRGIGSGETQPAWQQEEYTVAYTAEEAEQRQEAPAAKHEHENDALYENSLWTYGEGATDIAAHEQADAISAETTASAVNPLFPDEAVYTGPAAVAQPPQKDKEAKVRTHSLNTPTGYAAAELTAHPQKADKAPQEPVASHFLAANDLNPAETARISGSTEALGAESGEPEAEIHAVHKEEPQAVAEAVENAANPPAEAAAETLPANENELFTAPDVQPVPEEKPDLKIALGSKKEEKAEEREPLTYSTLLSSSRAHREQENQHAQEQEAAVPAAAPDAGNDTEWKSRFIGGRGGTELFRKVRLCIVQREETLDTIAEKYQLSARELVMYNRLSGQNVEEGQVLYIP
ncbi:LysM peptidoglycan-binding domain-containing protein [Paenibacillus graminis]|uniref:LysM peptidoglycan-binding domain-containing protein n=1 Tax=Paenibacillus graminis TaxID=189425 RepID=UPI002DBB26C8|nr:LysM peptidoglycan-binding domain-containing protein [Paenibacillus graminis]MEC0168488.1 LysM peptidoglycan-binding domain-containing protein [Paenibacillus graminis]